MKMPLRDGTGPPGGGGAGTGRGAGGGRRGRMGGAALGPGGECFCPNCKRTFPHQRGVPCNQIKCPNCGAAMTRPR